MDVFAVVEVDDVLELVDDEPGEVVEVEVEPPDVLDVDEVEPPEVDVAVVVDVDRGVVVVVVGNTNGGALPTCLGATGA